MKSFDDNWRAWVESNLREGCPKDALFKILHDCGFGYQAIRELLGHEPQVPLARIVSPLSALAADPSWAAPSTAGGRVGNIDFWLGPRASLDPPETLAEENRTLQEAVPHVGAGGPGCRGFETRRLPESLFAELRAGFHAVEDELAEESEPVRHGYLATTNRLAPAAVLATDRELNAKVLTALKPLHESWCGFTLEPSACYGFRVYLPGAFLRMHVDRSQTHVISSAICVARDVDAPWPLRIEDVDGCVSEVDLDPGELVLYESARVLHGRPNPLNGRFHVGLFVHFRPAEDGELWAESPKAWWRKHGGAPRPD